MNPTTKVIIADDHPTFRLGLAAIISQDSRFQIVGEAQDGAEAWRLIQSYRPAVAVVDWNMPGMDGLEITRQVRRSKLATRVIILTMHEEESLFNEAMDAGVSAFVLKDNAVNDILDCLRAVDRGDVYLSPAVSNYLFRRSRRAADLRQQKPGLDQLTAMEKRVLKLVAENRTTKEIARSLGVSPRTIETHRRNICQKLELTGSHRLLQFALKHREAL
jgi:DNA-binding NarL/FixJ family response regulator